LVIPIPAHTANLSSQAAIYIGGGVIRIVA